MSWFGDIVDKVLPGAPSRNFTESTWDKWIAPEHKDTLETIATMVGTAAIAPWVIAKTGWNPAVVKGLLGAGGAWANNQNPVVGGITGALSGGKNGKYFSALSGLLGSSIFGGGAGGGSSNYSGTGGAGMATDTGIYGDLLRKLLSSIDYSYNQRKTEANQELEASMLHRGILGSGIHTEDLGNINAKLERARAAASNAAALGVYGASQQDRDMANQMYQWEVGRADQQSAMNQEKRFNITSMLGSLAGAYLGGGMARPQMDLGDNVGTQSTTDGVRMMERTNIPPLNYTANDFYNTGKYNYLNELLASSYELGGY